MQRRVKNACISFISRFGFIDSMGLKVNMRLWIRWVCRVLTCCRCVCVYVCLVLVFFIYSTILPVACCKCVAENGRTKHWFGKNTKGRRRALNLFSNPSHYLKNWIKLRKLIQYAQSSHRHMEPKLLLCEAKIQSSRYWHLMCVVTVWEVFLTTKYPSWDK